MGQNMLIQVLDQPDKTLANYNHIISEQCYCLKLYYAVMSSEECSRDIFDQLPPHFVLLLFLDFLNPVTIFGQNCLI